MILSKQLTKIIGEDYQFNERISGYYTALISDISTGALTSLRNLGCEVLGCTFVPASKRLSVDFLTNDTDGNSTHLRSKDIHVVNTFMYNLTGILGAKVIGSVYIIVPKQYINFSEIKNDDALLAPDKPTTDSRFIDVDGSETTYAFEAKNISNRIAAKFGAYTYGIFDESTLQVRTNTIKSSKELKAMEEYSSAEVYEVYESEIQDDLTLPSSQFLYEKGNRYKGYVPIMPNSFKYTIESLKELI